LSPIRCEILACQINTVVGMPMPLLRKSLSNYYIARLREREIRHARAQHDWIDYLEESGSGSSTISPHALFSECFNITYNFFQRLFRQNNNNAYEPIHEHEGNVFRRSWSILPDLSKETCIQQIECPICFQTTNNKVTVECSHEFCEKCFIHYVENGSILRAPLCPVCRKCIKNITIYNSDAYCAIINNQYVT